MYVTVLVRMSGGDRDTLIGLGKQAKSIVEKAGAESFSLVQVFTGPHTGDLLVAVRFPNWDVLGKAQQSFSNDPAFLALAAQIAPCVAERNLVVGLI